MKYEPMTQVQQTLSTYSQRVLGTYEGRLAHACSSQVHAFMDAAIDRERALGRKICTAAEELPADRACDAFRVRDRNRLFRALELLQHGSLADTENARAFVQDHDEALVVYCRALHLCAHSPELLLFLDALVEARLAPPQLAPATVVDEPTIAPPTKLKP